VIDLVIMVSALDGAPLNPRASSRRLDLRLRNNTNWPRVAPLYGSMAWRWSCQKLRRHVGPLWLASPQDLTAGNRPPP